MTEQTPIVIVGTGLSGYSLVREFRKLDKEIPVIMVTADDGVSYSKPMLSTGFTKDKDADGLAQANPEAMAEQLGVEIRPWSTVTGIDTDAHELKLGDQRIRYAKLVLAWGADVI
ncbi:MAG: FAD-dependent oxidoreductase, partial [Pseudomonadota bacterium]|nr:FAD-dependent oxidoreductase [Pseudomonadota bacterium]